MSSDDLERRLTAAFAAEAHRAVDDRTVPPPLHLDPVRRGGRRRSVGKILAPLATAAAIAAVAVGIAVHNGSSSTAGRAVAGPTSNPKPASTAPSGTSAIAASSYVDVSLQNVENQQVGVGMPVIAYLSKPITDARAFNAATTVTVDGKPATGSWYFESKAGLPGKPIEADWRMPNYWPAHAAIHVSVAAKGLSAGGRLVFADSLSLDFRTGAANLVTVDNSSHLLTVMSDGVKWGSFPVSLGATTTPTLRGVKVIMAKGVDIAMSGPGYHILHVQYTQRLTYGGEYLHAAPWNVHNIESGVDSSNGCTNLTLADAAKLFNFLEVGDVVSYPDATGQPMQMSEGYGDWNIPWATWLTGGLVPTH